MKLGYACINMTLRKEGITTNRSMIRRTFDDKGINYCSELAYQNCENLVQITKWNIQNGFLFFRLSSELFPWASEYNIKDLPHYNLIKSQLKQVGDLVDEYRLRITSHPGPFNVLTSPKESVVQNTIRDLEIHGEVFDMIGLEKSPYNKINIHCNGVYGDKKKAMDRFCQNFQKLSPSVRNRLTVENDDKASMYSVKDLMYIHEKIGIPIVFDYHHHKFNTGGWTEEEALKVAVSTWPRGITPVVHYSESKSVEMGDSKIKPQAHSDYIKSLPDTYGEGVDVMVESKMKELAIKPFLLLG